MVTKQRITRVPITLVNVGNAPNDGSGDFNRDAFIKLNNALTTHQNELAEKALKTDLNPIVSALGDKADKTELAPIVESLETKADKTELAPIVESLETKAAQTDLTALDLRVAANTQAIIDIETAGVDVVALAGNGLEAVDSKLTVKAGVGITVDAIGARISDEVFQIIDSKADALEMESHLLNINSQLLEKSDTTYVNNQLALKANLSAVVVKVGVDPYSTLGYPMPMGYIGIGSVAQWATVPGSALTAFHLLMSRGTGGYCAGFSSGTVAGTWQSMGSYIGDWNAGGTTNLPIGIFRRVA